MCTLVSKQNYFSRTALRYVRGPFLGEDGRQSFIWTVLHSFRSLARERRSGAERTGPERWCARRNIRDESFVLEGIAAIMRRLAGFGNYVGDAGAARVPVLLRPEKSRITVIAKANYPPDMRKN